MFIVQKSFNKSRELISQMWLVLDPFRYDTLYKFQGLILLTPKDKLLMIKTNGIVKMISIIIKFGSSERFLKL